MSANVPEANFEYIQQEPFDLEAELVPETHTFEVELITGDLHYTHYQDIPADTWYIVHNLNKEPSIQVLNSAGTVIYPDIKHTSTNTAELYFKSAMSGRAICN